MQCIQLAVWGLHLCMWPAHRNRKRVESRVREAFDFWLQSILAHCLALFQYSSLADLVPPKVTYHILQPVEQFCSGRSPGSSYVDESATCQRSVSFNTNRYLQSAQRRVKSQILHSMYRWSLALLTKGLKPIWPWKFDTAFCSKIHQQSLHPGVHAEENTSANLSLKWMY